MDKVFVYGTLMKGYMYHMDYLAQSQFLGKGEISGFALYAVTGSYPGIIPECGERVKGEVYEVDQETLKRIDDLEDEGSLYFRKKVEVLVQGEGLQAWVYIWNHETGGTEKINYDDQPWKAKE